MLDAVVRLEVEQCLGDLGEEVRFIEVDDWDEVGHLRWFRLTWRERQDVVIAFGDVIEKFEVERGNKLRKRLTKRG